MLKAQARFPGVNDGNGCSPANVGSLAENKFGLLYHKGDMYHICYTMLCSAIRYYTILYITLITLHYITLHYITLHPMHACMHACICIYIHIHACMHTDRQTDIQTDRQTHTHIHTHIRTYDIFSFLTIQLFGSMIWRYPRGKVGEIPETSVGG